MQSNSGFEPADLTLAVLRPEEAGPEPAESLDRLWVSAGTHTQYLEEEGGNSVTSLTLLNRLKNEWGISLLRMQKAGSSLRLKVIFQDQDLSWLLGLRVPGKCQNLLNSNWFLCENEKIAKSVCAYVDDTDSNAPTPRRFQNAILAITATPSAFNTALDCAQRL